MCVYVCVCAFVSLILGTNFACKISVKKKKYDFVTVFTNHVSRCRILMLRFDQNCIDLTMIYLFIFVFEDTFLVVNNKNAQ